MSSFLVSDKTINNIVTGLTSNIWIEGLMWEYPFKNLTGEELNNLGRELLKLNHYALNQRYKEKINNQRYKEKINNKEINKYVFSYQSSSLLQFIKNLNCFLYQCSEGKTINKKMFKLLTKIQQCFYYKVVSGLEDYKKSEWGY